MADEQKHILFKISQELIATENDNEKFLRNI